MLNHLLTSNETAKLLRTSRGVLANWRSEGRGPAYLKLNKKILYQREELLRWLDLHKIRTTDSVA